MYVIKPEDKMDSLFFSIIVPVYNVERYLRKCVDSILIQSYKNYELILVDDGSPDMSGEICDEYSSKYDNINVIHKKNGGSSDARNFGVGVSKGQYIIFLDSDDFFRDGNLLLSLYERAKEHNEDLIIYSSINIFYSLGPRKRYGDYDIHNCDRLDKDALLEYLYKTNNFPGAAWTCCVKSEILFENNIKFPIGVTGEDYIWILKVLEKVASIGLCNDAVVMHLMDSPGSITSKARISGFRGINLCLNYYLKKDYRWPLGIRKHMAYIFLIALYSYVRLSDTDRKEASKLLKEVKDVLRHSDDKRHRLFYYFMNIFGLSFSSRVVRYLRG